MNAEPRRLHILHVDQDLLVIEKPAGLLSVPGRGEDKQDCLSTRVQALYPDALVVHRLDMATSGLMLMARGKAAQSALNRAFAGAEVHKRYVALVHGHPAQQPLLDPDPEAATAWQLVDLPIAVDWPRRPLRIIPATGGKASQTRWRILASHARHSRVELEPITGRSHQLRVHMLAIGHPILGDPLYNPSEATDVAPRLMLHACELRFAHPAHGAEMQFHNAPEF